MYSDANDSTKVEETKLLKITGEYAAPWELSIEL